MAVTSIIAPVAPPPLNIPDSNNTVTVRIIDTTTEVTGHPDLLFQPTVGGKTRMTFNAYAFLVENPRNDQKLLFDLGMRKDWENFAPHTLKNLVALFELKCEKGVDEILMEEGVPLTSINSIIWSHWHYDHTGDPSRFPPSTSLIVGPGTTTAKLPGYPKNPDSDLLETDFAGRKLTEIPDSDFNIKIGNWNALDFFGDQSFYLLNAPGHAIGHICGLARTTADTFILMGADACHHGGEYRPSKHLPLPENISPNPYNAASQHACPCHIFESIHPTPEKYRTEVFYKIRVNEDGSSIAIDHEEADRTITKVQESDATENIFVVCAHDPALVDVIDIFPKDANSWKDAGWKERVRWTFLRDYKVEGYVA